MVPALRVVSVQVGRVRPVGGAGATLESAIDKRPVEGPIALGPTGLEGDEIGHPRHHGGPDQALLMFAASNARAFERRLARPLPPGSFGENVTVEGCDERDVRLGDVFAWGAAELEVSAPRLPCGTLARHLRDDDIVDAIGTPHRAGWYVRIRRPAAVSARDPLRFDSRGDADWTIERAAAVRREGDDPEALRALARVAALSASWRAWIARRLAGAS